MHVLTRLNQRYGNKFTVDDVGIINTLIKRGLYLEIVKDFIDRERIIILLKYNNTPMKLVYSKSNKCVVTVLPLDIEEYNQYSALVPDVNTDGHYSQNPEEEALKIRNKFETGVGAKEIKRVFNLEDCIKNAKKFYIKNYSQRFVILWFKEGKNEICYQLYSRKTLQKRLWHFVIDGFRKQDTQLFKNAVLLYAKIFK